MVKYSRCVSSVLIPLVPFVGLSGNILSSKACFNADLNLLKYELWLFIDRGVSLFVLASCCKWYLKPSTKLLSISLNVVWGLQYFWRCFNVLSQFPQLPGLSFLLLMRLSKYSIKLVSCLKSLANPQPLFCNSFCLFALMFSARASVFLLISLSMAVLGLLI